MNGKSLNLGSISLFAGGRDPRRIKAFARMGYFVPRRLGRSKWEAMGYFVTRAPSLARMGRVHKRGAFQRWPVIAGSVRR